MTDSDTERVRMCQVLQTHHMCLQVRGGAVATTLHFTHPGSNYFSVETEFSCKEGNAFPLFIWAYHSLQQLFGNPTC